MIPYLCAFLLGFGLLFLIGLGPALALAPGVERRPGAPLLGLAPTLGLALVAALAGMVAEWGQPLGPWVWPGTAGLLALSAGLLAWRARRGPLARPLGAGGWFWCGWLALGLALLLPAAFGGLSWLLGNHFSGDAFNYAGLSLAYERLGWKPVNAHPIDWVASHHMAMLRARNFADRLGTPFLIGWEAHWGGVNPVLWCWYQALLAVFMAWPLFFSWLLRLRVKPWAAAWASFLALTGFWVVLAQALSAFSYLSSLPLMAALALLASDLDRSPRHRWLRWILGSLLLHALLLVYSELVVLLVLTLLLGTLFARRKGEWLANWAIMILGAHLVDPPMAWYHTQFIWRQLVTHTGTPVGDARHVFEDFSKAFYWLSSAPDWARPFRALWGYWPAPITWAGWGGAWQVAGDLAGILATLGLLAGLRHLKLRHRPLAWLLFLLALLPMAMALAALVFSTPGVYGKLITFGGPYLPLLLALGLFGGLGPRQRFARAAALPWALGLALSLAAWYPQLAQRCALRYPYPYAGMEDIDQGLWQDELGPVCRLMCQHQDELLLVSDSNMLINEWALFSMPDQRMDFLGQLSLDARPVDGRPGPAPRWLLIAREDLAGGDLRRLPVPALFSHHYALFSLGPGDLERFTRYLYALHGSWCSEVNITPAIQEYRIVADGKQRFRATLKPLPGAPASLKVCLRLNRSQDLLAWGSLGPGRSVVFTPGPGVQRLELAAPKDVKVGEKAALSLAPWPPAKPGAR
jgi:hypothetical protein